ncbi:MAG: hypothetical protein ACYSW3_30650, partial [Planctomycetota bacterium]
SSVAKMRQPAQLTDEALLNLNDYLHKVNPEGETMQDILIKAFTDYWTYGNAFIELIRSEIETDEGVQRWLVIRHIPMIKCRPKKVTEGEEIYRHF